MGWCCFIFRNHAVKLKPLVSFHFTTMTLTNDPELILAWHGDPPGPRPPPGLHPALQDLPLLAVRILQDPTLVPVFIIPFLPLTWTCLRITHDRLAIELYGNRGNEWGRQFRNWLQNKEGRWLCCRNKSMLKWRVDKFKLILCSTELFPLFLIQYLLDIGDMIMIRELRKSRLTAVV